MRWAILAMFWGTQALDIWSTKVALAMGGVEGNPLMAPIIDTHWIYTLKLGIAPLVLAVLYLLGAKSWPVAGLTLAYLGIVLWNLNQILGAVT